MSRITLSFVFLCEVLVKTFSIIFFINTCEKVYESYNYNIALDTYPKLNMRITPMQWRKILEASAKERGEVGLTPEQEASITRMGEKTNLQNYLDSRLEMLENIPDDLPQITRLTVAITVDASKRLAYFAKLLNLSKSGLANDILEEAIYDLEELLCGDLFDDTETAKKHRKALKIGEFEEEKKTKTKRVPVSVDEQGNLVWSLKNGKDGKDE